MSPQRPPMRHADVARVALWGVALAPVVWGIGVLLLLRWGAAPAILSAAALAAVARWLWSRFHTRVEVWRMFDRAIKPLVRVPWQPHPPQVVETGRGMVVRMRPAPAVTQRRLNSACDGVATSIGYRLVAVRADPIPSRFRRHRAELVIEMER